VNRKYKLRCITCGRIYDPDDVEYTCLQCGDRFGTLEVVYDYENVRLKKSNLSKEGDIWQFLPLLPLSENCYRVPLRVGGTPLYSFRDLGKKLGLKNLLIKYDGGNPTGSYKDRATAIAIAKAYEKGYDTIYCASTGNAASSLAGLSAPSGLKTYIFLPAKAPIAKISQLFVYGARVVAVDGSYDIAFDISMKIGKEKGWYSRNSAINPYLLEGKKTGALEIAVQNDWNVPDFIIVGVGDGTVISSIYKGFFDLYSIGFIDGIPRIIGVQAEGADSVKKAFEAGKPFKPYDIEAKTVADSISVGKPRDVIKACKYVEKSKGFFITVSDEEIIESVKELAEETGIFAEPAGAVSHAGMKKLINKGFFEKEDTVCLVVTGNGLKDIKAVERFVNLKPVKPDLESVREVIEEYENKL